MNKWEPVYTEVDESEDPVQTTSEKIPRSKKILRDKRSREALQMQMQRRNLPIEEQEEAEVEEWYKSIRNLGDSVILIPFDKEDLDKNDEALLALGAVFGISPDNYEDFFEKVNMLYGRYKTGSVETFKLLFPALWSDIEEVLSKKDLNENDVVFMLYNQANSPRLPNFTKDPSFFGHDIGHNVFDSDDSDWEYKGILNNFIANMYDLYLSKPDEDSGEEATSAVNELGDQEEDTMMYQLGNFFDNPSGPGDSYADVFSSVARGELAGCILFLY